MQIKHPSEIHGDALAEAQEAAALFAASGVDWEAIESLGKPTIFRLAFAYGWGARDMRDREPDEVGAIVVAKYARGEIVAMRTEQGDWEVTGAGESHRRWTQLIDGAESWERLR